jgi:hypothetical protein
MMPAKRARETVSRKAADTMGGVYGYVKGKTKIACYLNFRREVNRKEIEESTGSNMDAGTGTKKELYRQMNN